MRGECAHLYRETEFCAKFGGVAINLPITCSDPYTPISLLTAVIHAWIITGSRDVAKSKLVRHNIGLSIGITILELYFHNVVNILRFCRTHVSVHMWFDEFTKCWNRNSCNFVMELQYCYNTVALKSRTPLSSPSLFTLPLTTRWLLQYFCHVPRT